MKCMSLAGPGLLLLLLAGASLAKEYAGPDGLGFTYPDAWLLVAKPKADPAIEQAMARFSNISRSILETPNLQAFIFNPADDGYAESITLSVLPGRMRLDEKSVEQFVQALNSSLTSSGAKIQRQEVTRIRVDGLESLSVLSLLEQSQSHEESTLWQVAIPARKNLISFSFIARTDEFAKHRPAFQQVLDTCRVGGQNVGGGWLGGLPQPMRDSITYGSIFLGLLLLAWSLRRMRRLREVKSVRQPPTQGPEPEEP